MHGSYELCRRFSCTVLWRWLTGTERRFHLPILPCLRPFPQHDLLSAYYVSSAVLCTGDTVVSKADPALPLWSMQTRDED